MKNSEESYSIIIFRGVRANPLRLKLRKSLMRNLLIAGLGVLLLQGGILAHYLFQRSQLTELESMRQELSTSQGQTSTFAGEIDSMKKRMVSLEFLNRKLQTMFGLEPDALKGSENFTPGQGGVEIPYENSGLNSEEMLITPPHSPRNQEITSQLSKNNQQISGIAKGLQWLNTQAAIEQKILDLLAGTASKRAERWASTPSILPVKGVITSKFGPRVSPFTGKKALHAGIDIGAPKGTKIYAPGAGKVVVAGHEGRMGKFVRRSNNQ